VSKNESPVIKSKNRPEISMQIPKDGNPYFGSVRRQLASVSRDMPELLNYQLRAGSGIGLKTPVLTQEKPLSREEVEKMSEEEVNSNWRRVQRFLQGERSQRMGFSLSVRVDLPEDEWRDILRIARRRASRA
jgi:hypothetical protein